MKKLIVLFSLLGSLALACPNGSCGGMYDKSVMGTLAYALNIMKLQDDPQIAMAIQSYRMKVSTMPRGMDTDAFKNAAFDRAVFLQKSRKVQKAQAQADLFEELYKLLDTEQKQRLHQLMAAHQYYMGGLESNRCGMQKKNCNCPGDGSCGCQAGKPTRWAGGKSCGCNGKPSNRAVGPCAAPQRDCPN